MVLNLKQNTMGDYIILGIIALMVIGGLIESMFKARSSIRTTIESHKNPKILSAEYAGIPLNVCIIEHDKVLIQVGVSGEDHNLHETKVWFTKESIPSEWRNVGVWFKVSSGENNSVLYEKVLMYRGEDPTPINA